MHTKPLYLALALSFGVTSAHAALHDRGGGLIYDDVLNITWLQDANYAKTSGYDADGLMTWDEAVQWAANLVYHDSVRNVDYSDWRLPQALPVNGVSYNFTYSYDGSTDWAENISAPGSAHPGSTASELAYMFYVNLGNKSIYTPSGALQGGYGLTNAGPFLNLKLTPNPAFWTGTASRADAAVLFYTGEGVEGPAYKISLTTPWLVRPGDVAAVPEPESWALLLAGFGLVASKYSRRMREARISPVPTPFA